jgi:CheY-like chemotaxis protein
VSALSAATRAASLTQRLLGFSRRHQLDWRSTDVNAVVQEVVGLLTHTIDPRIRIEPCLHAELWPVQADPSQLNQVLMNLCINARDAIDGAGTITIETACMTPEQLRKLQGPLDANTDYVRLRVTDTGSGIPPEVKARMYEPFFTTKDVGKGTGLGLAMVFSIVRQHKGWIDCHTEVGHGTTFDVYLPRAASDTVADIESTPFVKRRDGKETILVVDDEELIRKIATATLERAGYRVLEAADGQEAVSLYSKMQNRIDLVILDLTMPVLSGHEAFRLFLDMNARVRVLFTSGYAVEQLSELEKELMAGFVKKPFRPHELLAAVAEAFTKKPGTKPGSRVANSPLPLQTVAS